MNYEDNLNININDRRKVIQITSDEKTVNAVIVQIHLKIKIGILTRRKVFEKIFHH
jgi:hypothetical protein